MSGIRKSARGAVILVPLSLFSHKRKSGMFERWSLTNKLDAAIGVKEAETGYRDTWRIWLAGGWWGVHGWVCRLLKTREFAVGVNGAAVALDEVEEFGLGRCAWFGRPTK